MNDLICPACKRSVDHLTEILLIETEERLRVTRCDDCWEVAREKMGNALNN